MEERGEVASGDLILDESGDWGRECGWRTLSTTALRGLVCGMTAEERVRVGGARVDRLVSAVLSKGRASIQRRERAPSNEAESSNI